MVIRASELPRFAGFDINRLALFRWNGSDFEAIPFQVDEVSDFVDLVAPVADCADTTLPPNSAVCERNYTFNSDAMPIGDQPGLEGSDELVFVARDAGPEASPDISYPTSGAWYTWRYDIAIQDEKLVNGAVVPQNVSWVYLFYSTIPIDTPLYGDRHYAEWTTDPDSGDPVPPTGTLPAENCRTGDPVLARGKLACGWARPFVDQTNGLWSLPGIEAHWIGNWTLNRTRFRVAGQPSAGSDVVDRLKWRLGEPGSGIFYSEYLWDTTCARMIGLKYYDGTKRSPIRILRKIQGNKSGSTSTHNDWYYGTHLRTRVRLRVHHGLPALRVFTDYLKAPPGKSLYTKTYPTVPADTIDGLGSDHSPIATYTPGMWMRWDTQVSSTERVYTFLKETRLLQWASAISDYSDDGTTNTEAVGTLQKEAGAYGNHGVKWYGNSLEMQDRSCNQQLPDDPTKLWKEVELLQVAAPPNKTAADVEDWLTRPLGVYPTERSLPYIAPPQPDPPCTPSGTGSSPASGIFAELSANISGPCAPATTGLAIYRAVGAGAFQFLSRTIPGSTFKDASVLPGVTYKYKVYGNNRAGQFSGASNTIVVQVQDTEAPSPPADLLAEARPLSARLTWTASSSWDAIGHDVYLSTTSGGPYLKVTAQPVPIQTTEFTISGLDAYTSYYAVIQAVDRVGNHSANSSEVSFVPLP